MPPLTLGAGLIMGASALAGGIGAMSGPKEQTTTTTTNDRMSGRDRAALDMQRRQANDLYAQSGQFNNSQRQASGNYGQLAGGIGFGMQRGAQGIEGYLNPGLENMQNAQNVFWDQARADVGQQANAQAVGSNAFGGSRAALNAGQQISNVTNQQGALRAQQQFDMWTQAMMQLQGDRQNALQFGLAGAQGQFGLGQQMWDQQRQAQAGQQNLLNYGDRTQTATTSTPINRNFFTGMLGGAATGAGAYNMFTRDS